MKLKLALKRIVAEGDKAKTYPQIRDKIRWYKQNKVSVEKRVSAVLKLVVEEALERAFQKITPEQTSIPVFTLTVNASECLDSIIGTVKEKDPELLTKVPFLRKLFESHTININDLVIDILDNEGFESYRSDHAGDNWWEWELHWDEVDLFEGNSDIDWVALYDTFQLYLYHGGCAGGCDSDSDEEKYHLKRIEECKTKFKELSGCDIKDEKYIDLDQIGDIDYWGAEDIEMTLYTPYQEEIRMWLEKMAVPSNYGKEPPRKLKLNKPAEDDE